MSQQNLLENGCSEEGDPFSTSHVWWRWWITTSNPKWLQSKLSRRDLLEPALFVVALPILFSDIEDTLKNVDTGPAGLVLDTICFCSLRVANHYLSKKSLKFDVVVSLTMTCAMIAQLHIGKQLQQTTWLFFCGMFAFGIHSAFIAVVQASFLFALFMCGDMNIADPAIALSTSILAGIVEYHCAVATLQICWAEEVLLGAQQPSSKETNEKYCVDSAPISFRCDALQKVSKVVLPLVEQASYPRPFHPGRQPQDIRISSICFGVDDAIGRDAMGSEADETAESLDSILFVIARDCHLVFGLDEIFMEDVTRKIVADSCQILKQINAENTYPGRRDVARSLIQTYQNSILRELHHNISTLCNSGRLEKMVNDRRQDLEYDAEIEEIVSRAKAVLVEDLVNAYRVFLRSEASSNGSGFFRALTIVCQFLGRPSSPLCHNVLRRFPCALAMPAIRAEFEGPPIACSCC